MTKLSHNVIEFAGRRPLKAVKVCFAGPDTAPDRSDLRHRDHDTPVRRDCGRLHVDAAGAPDRPARIRDAS